MSREYMLIASAWIITITILIKFVPRNKVRVAHVAFLFKQVITWVIGLAIVEFGFIEYPVRLFAYANKTSFTFEYFVYPSICAIFNANYPENKNTFGRFMYYFYYCTALTIIEVLLEKHTFLIRYIHWNWFITLITLCITFYMTRKYCLWFFRLKQNN